VNTLIWLSVKGSIILVVLADDNDFLLLMSTGDPIGLPLFTEKVFFNKAAGDNEGDIDALLDTGLFIVGNT
jgi:hypothetical protein